MQATHYIVPAGPGAGTQCLVAVVTACRVIYRHAYLLGDGAYDLTSSTTRAYVRGDMEWIVANLSTICAALHEVEGGWDRWVEARDLLLALLQLM